MARFAPPGAELLRVLAEVARAAVGGGEHECDPGVGGHLAAVARERAGGPAEPVLPRRLPPQGLLEHAGPAARTGHPRPALSTGAGHRPPPVSSEEHPSAIRSLTS